MNDDFTSEGLGIATARGVLWTSISSLLTQSLNFIVFIILARLLVPSDFGLLGMVTILTGFIALFNELGLTAAIIQKKDISETHLSTAFWTSIGIGLGVFAVSLLLAPLVASFFGREILRSLVILVSTGFIFGSFGTVHSALLQKNLEFRKMAFAEIGTNLIYGLVSISLAVAGLGVWSLAIGSVTQAIASPALLWIVCRWRPRIHFNIDSCKSLVGFGAVYTGQNIMNYFGSNVDYLLVGKFLGTVSLGLYTFAYRFIDFTTKRISSVVTRVTFPAFSSVQDSNERIKRGYSRSLTYVSLITFPIWTGLFVVAPEFVTVIYGPKWVLAIIPLQILCIAGMVRSVLTTVGTIIISKGRPDIGLKWNTVFFVVLGITVLMGLRYGIVGVAWAVTAVTVIMAPFIQMIANALVGLRMREYLRSLRPAFFGSVLMLLILAFFRSSGVVLFNLSKNLILLGSIILGIVIYFLYLRFLEHFTYLEIKELLRITTSSSFTKIEGESK